MNAGQQQVRVSVVGAGYVGLVTGACLARLGHDVTCIDTRADAVASVNNGEPPFYEPGLRELLAQVLSSGRFRATSDLAASVPASDVTFVAVGTPSSPEGIDLRFIAEAARQIGEALRESERYHVVVVKSTVVPGTTAGLVHSVLERASRSNFARIGLCMNPEFLREGSAVDDFLNADRIVIGASDERAGNIVAGLYQTLDAPVVMTSMVNAELIKYASNCLLATLVSFSNELAAVCEVLPGADVDVVMDGLHLDRRFSVVTPEGRQTPGVVSYLRAGSGFGGSCFPKDLAAFRAFAAGAGVDTPILDAVAMVNQRRPNEVVGLISEAVGGLDRRALAVLGLTFKAGTDDLRDSPALALVRALADAGARVRVYDPIVISQIPDLPSSVQFCEHAADALRDADAAVIATAWPEFRTLDWGTLIGSMRQPLLIDGRNCLRGVALPPGLDYRPIGRGPIGDLREAKNV